jgi:hypothetical protein
MIFDPNFISTHSTAYKLYDRGCNELLSKFLVASKLAAIYPQSPHTLVEQELITTECEATFPKTLFIYILNTYINVTMSSRLTVIY